VRLARGIAFAVDVVQVVALPAFAYPVLGEGVQIVIDCVAAVLFCILLRPHWAFAPTFLAEAVPLVGVVPFWSLAVRYVTRGAATAAPVPPPLPPQPPPIEG
jgi:hypothetical protein